MNVAIIGSGLQARRRANAIQASEFCKLKTIVSDSQEAGESLANQFNAKVSTFEEVLHDSTIDCVVVCTPPSSHFEYVRNYLNAGKNVLVEKPFTRTIEESYALTTLSRDSVGVLRCGFNHRFHPSIQKLKELIGIGKLGEVKAIRSIYGIGLREGYTEEWRANQTVAAGGQFMEQGSHLIDISQYLVGEISRVFLKTQNSLIPNIYGEDTGTALLSHYSGAISNVMSSLLIWHNRFNLEVYGSEGFAVVEGLGASYGVETLSVAQRDSSKPFKVVQTQFRGADQSWALEWQAFLDSIQEKPSDIATPVQAHHVMQVVSTGYESSNKGIELELKPS